MKRQKIVSSTIALCLLMGMLALPGCTSGKETEKTTRERKRDETVDLTEEDPTILTEESIIVHPTDNSDETDATEATDETTGNLTESETEPSKDVEVDVTDTEATESEAGKEPAGEGLYEKAEKYINSAIAFYNHLYGQDMKLVVFESQIEENEEGFRFTVRSQAGTDANVYVADVKANVETGDMSGDNGMTWNISEYS